MVSPCTTDYTLLASEQLTSGGASITDWVSSTAGPAATSTVSTTTSPSAMEYPPKPGLTGPYIMPMPMPIGPYNGIEAASKKPRLGIIELVICNIGAMLASIAMDFDVRLANVSPVHPRLHARQLTAHGGDDETSTTGTAGTSRWWSAQSDANRGSNYLGPEYEFSSTSGYAHNTYHGPAKHCRPFLSSMSGIPGVHPASNLLVEKPLRFTDSPQHYPSSTAGGSATGSNAPTPSPRRKNSTASMSEQNSYSSELSRIDRLAPPAYASQSGYSDYGPPVYSILHPQHDYFRPIEPGYLAPSDYHDPMLECAEFPHAYDNPSSVNSPARTANRLPSYTHHRTPSNVSTASTSSQSNVNPSFRLEDEADYSSLYSPGHSLGYYRSHHSSAAPMQSSVGSYGSSILANHDYGPGLHYLTSRHQNSHEASHPNSIERPANLDITTRLRSSLKRSNYAYGSPNRSASRNNSGSGTPTNPTPPDSLTSEDSSYVSAKDGQISLGRVRFSPVTFDRELLQTPVQELTSPLQLQATSRARLASQTSRNRKPSITELDRDFLS
ncbi:uncharacterized protein LOC106647676 [Copidosoma floridanum]|uniref:uncharacterized protein LOC106647676 n=1 Tax=Copidosoma floridanum TaxID=29053 RepID=UPI0006C9D0D6|nr:uncharacterized protein LOC106647676 [Copidosoma floridanum]